MDQYLDRPASETCAKGTLRGIAAVGCLLMAGVIASVVLVDHPLHVAQRAPAYVPASGPWIELGARPGTPLSAADAAALERHAENKPSHRTGHGVSKHDARPAAGSPVVHNRA